MKKLNIHHAGKSGRIPALLVVIAVILAVIAGITFAKYVLQKEHVGVAEAEAFYFESDLLKEESKTYYIDPETTSIPITFSNAADSKRVTPENIEVSVTVEGGTIEKADESFTLKGSTKKEQVVEITPSDGEKVVTVTATSTSPYQKILKASFHLAPGNQYKVEDAQGNRAAVLTITYAQSTAEGITIKVSDNLIPDATNTFVSKNSEGTYTYNPEEEGVYSLVLLKKDTSVNISTPETEFTEEISIKSGADTTP